MDRINDKRIRETLAFKELTEEEKTKRHILGRLYGPIADVVRPTRNGRKYTEELWERVFENPIMKEKFNNKVMYGELGHPEDRTEVDIEKAAICMPELPKKDKSGYLIGYFDILDTPSGRILKTLCDYGSHFGVSSRGTGDVIADENGNEEVDPDTYVCECWDIVPVPAVEKARLTFTEGLSGKKPLSEALKSQMDSATEEDRKIMKESLEAIGVIGDGGDAAAEPLPEPKHGPDGDECHGDDEPHDEPEGDGPKRPLGFEKAKELVKNALGVELTRELYDELIGLFASEQGEEDGRIEDGESSAHKEDNHEPEGEGEPDAGEAADGGANIEESLKETLKSISEKDREIKELKEKAAVGNAKVERLMSESSKQKEALVRLSKIARRAKSAEKRASALEGLLKKKREEIKVLSQKAQACGQKAAALGESAQQGRAAESIKEEADRLRSDMKSLKERLAEAEETARETKSLKERLGDAEKRARGYKSLANKAAERYVEAESKASGVNPDDVRKRLPENYGLDDIDKAIKSLASYSMRISRLPFAVSRGSSVVVKESNRPEPAKKGEDDADEATLRLAGIAE